MKLIFAISVIAAAAATAAQAATPMLYVFGDSLSDIGTLKRMTLGLYPPPSYWQGRFSSGPVWPEYLALLLGYDMYNKAVGGATSDNNDASLISQAPLNLVNIPSCQDQINLFRVTQLFYMLSSTRNSDIVVHEIGSNDFFAEVDKMTSGTLTQESFIATLSATVMDQLEQLRRIGFKNLLIHGMPHMQATPYAKEANIEGLVASTAARYNAVLRQQVAEWTATSRGLGNVTIVPLGEFVDATALSPVVSHAMGLTNTDTPCINSTDDSSSQDENKLTALLNRVANAKDENMCADPSAYYFLDTVHPTERFHRLLGYFIKHIVDAVRRGQTYDLSQANLLSLIRTYNLGTPAPKPARV